MKNNFIHFQLSYKMPYFPTSKADQNPLESEFGVYRGMDGSNVDPNALELCWRISRHIIDKILKDPEVDIDLFKIPLQNHLRSLQYDDELDYDSLGWL